jgi:hypothetical protein
VNIEDAVLFLLCFVIMWIEYGIWSGVKEYDFASTDGENILTFLDWLMAQYPGRTQKAILTSS